MSVISARIVFFFFIILLSDFELYTRRLLRVTWYGFGLYLLYSTIDVPGTYDTL